MILEADIEYRTDIKGWVDKDGIFYGKDKKRAIYANITHKTCECGEIMPKFYSRCSKCSHTTIVEQYNKLEYKEWDGETPLTLYDDDKFFWGEDEVEEYLEDNELEIEDLMLIICEPNYLWEVESDYWEDILDEDMNLPSEVEKKLEELNKAIRESKPVSWGEGKYRTNIKF